MQKRHERRLPVTVVTGFLGAGKTTLLRHLLRQSQARLAVVVNEFGEVGIDGELIASCGFCPQEELAGRLVELANGCLCCTVQEEFLPTMQQLLERADQLDGIVVETSGLALPEPLVAAFRWPEIRSRVRVHAVVTVVDGEALAQGHVVGDGEAVEAQRRADPSLDHLVAIEDLFEDQLAAADLVLVSRADRLEPPALQAVQQRLTGHLRPGTAVLSMAHGAVPVELLIDPGPSAGASRPAAATTATSDAAQHPELDHHHDDHDHHDHDHHDHDQHDHDQHDHDQHHDQRHVAMQSLVLQRQGSWQRQELESRLRHLIETQPVLRLKGRWQQRGKQRLLQIQAVGPRFDSWYEGEAGPEATDRLELVLLTAAAHADQVCQSLEGI